MARHSDATRSTFSPSKDECSPASACSSKPWTSTNPQDLLAFLALLPQFTRQAAAPPVTAQILVFGAIHIIGCAAVYLAGEYGEATVLANRPKVAITVRILSGIGLGIEQTITT